MIGERVGKLTVLRKASKHAHYGWNYECQCDCGNVTTVRGTRLRGGQTKSCGCLAKLAGERSKTHGMSGTKTYTTWINMIRRCDDPSQQSYPNYGGRGITVCKRWYRFENFLEDVGEIPDGMSIDRIDNDGNYEPSNVRLADIKDQANNRRTNRIIEFDGKAMTVSQWAEHIGVSADVLYKRLEIGMPLENALTQPAGFKNFAFEYEGRTQNLSQWAKESGIPYPCLHKRIVKYGWPFDRAITTPARHKTQSSP